MGIIFQFFNCFTKLLDRYIFVQLLSADVKTELAIDETGAERVARKMWEIFNRIDWFNYHCWCIWTRKNCTTNVYENAKFSISINANDWNCFEFSLLNMWLTLCFNSSKSTNSGYTNQFHFFIFSLDYQLKKLRYSSLGNSRWLLYCF